MRSPFLARSRNRCFHRFGRDTIGVLPSTWKSMRKGGSLEG